MTAPKPSAAELREAFVEEWNTREHWDSGGARMGAALDALIAAVRAEAQRETYAMAARIADFEGAHGVSNRIRALAVRK